MAIEFIKSLLPAGRAAKEQAEYDEFYHTWKPHRFNYYVEKLMLGRDPIQPGSTPWAITLGRRWHDLFWKMRFRENYDGLERFARVGLESETLKLQIPDLIGVGLAHEISQEAQTRYISQLRSSGLQIPETVPIHSHSDKSIRKENGFTLPTFSEDDIFNLIQQNSPINISFLVTSDSNQLVLRTSQATPNPLEDCSNVDLESFRKTLPLLDRSRSYETVEEATIKEAALANVFRQEMWKKFGLVFYEGKPDERLMRVFPAPPRPLRSNQ